ncbi:MULTISPECIES: hypothetical protein [unclassified Microcoleus]|uniref:hypothetical protein n=1 Tax=unclassified Microcoleus TaxID=2642155 RepID=UPI002FCF1F57
MNSLLKPVKWIGSSFDGLREFPEDVQQIMGLALYRAQDFSTERLFSFLNALGSNVEMRIAHSQPNVQAQTRIVVA